MPFKDWAPAPISGIFGLASNLITNRQNKKREKGRRVYEQAQELDRRKYDQAMWDKVNKYNNPIAQMERLKNAGLNPNLIYGSSPGSATGNAGDISSGKQLQGQAPQYQLDNPMVPFMDTKVKQAQTNNLNTAAMKNIAGANLSDSQRNRLNDLLASEVTMAEEGAKKSKIETFLKDLEKTGKSKHYIANMAAETEKAVQEASISEARKHIMQLDATLAKQGIRPQDKQWITLMARIFGIDVSKPWQNMKFIQDNVLNKLRYYNIPRF
jgi:hypothetical protein